AGFIHHAGRQVVGPPNQDGLTQSGNADRISCSAIAEIYIEVVSAIEQIARHEVVIAALVIKAVYKIKVVGRRWENASDTTELNAGTDYRGFGWTIKNVLSRKLLRIGINRREGIASGDRVRTEFVQRSQSIRIETRAGCQLGQTGRRRCQRIRVED